MSMYRESETLELKERYTDQICREIVAFLNKGEGQILIGIRDDGVIIGVIQTDEIIRKISDIIATQIEPAPLGEVHTGFDVVNDKILIKIDIKVHKKRLYYQKKYGLSPRGCAIRVGTTCRDLPQSEIAKRFRLSLDDTDLILHKRAQKQDLNFTILKLYYAEKGYHLMDDSFVSNFSLHTEDGYYNILAELLADTHSIPCIFVKFRGLNKAAISERTDYGYHCIISSYTKIKDRLIAENICSTDTSVRPRRDSYLFDQDCVNEAVLNALIHNDWTITEPQISMFSDRIEIYSHGGLPAGLSEEEFFRGVSKPRNTILARVFLSLGIIEHTGHGIPKILERYGREAFRISDRSICCTIPFDPEVLRAHKGSLFELPHPGTYGDYQRHRCCLHDTLSVQSPEPQYDADPIHGAYEPDPYRRLSSREQEVLALLREDGSYTAALLAEKLCVTTRTIERCFSSLQQKGYIVRIGARRNGYWQLQKPVD